MCKVDQHGTAASSALQPWLQERGRLQKSWLWQRPPTRWPEGARHRAHAPWGQRVGFRHHRLSCRPRACRGWETERQALQAQIEGLKRDIKSKRGGGGDGGGSGVSTAEANALRQELKGVKEENVRTDGEGGPWGGQLVHA